MRQLRGSAEGRNSRRYERARAWQSKNKTKEESSGPHLLLTAVQTCQPNLENSNTTLG